MLVKPCSRENIGCKQSVLSVSFLCHSERSEESRRFVRVETLRLRLPVGLRYAQGDTIKLARNAVGQKTYLAKNASERKLFRYSVICY